MFHYFIRRLLLIPPTLILITFLVFGITRLMPGGPLERMLQQAAIAGDEGQASTDTSSETLGEDELEELEELYGLDKPWFIAYFQWLGVWKKESFITKKEFGGDQGEQIGGLDINPETTVELVLKGSSDLVIVKRKEDKIISATLKDGTSVEDKGWSYRLETEMDRQSRYRKRNRITDQGATTPGYKPRVVLYRARFSGLLQGKLGRSILFGDEVLDMILERIPIAAYFGILTALITYGVSLPLGILKAVKHRTPIDSITSVLIFLGYSIPGFALGAILLIWLGARLELFPLFGFVSPHFSNLPLLEQIKNLVHHTTLPLICYVVGGFAYLTMMMKNNLMDNLAADYVKTAVSKGASYTRAVFGHAFRNSLIPIATTFGQLITLFVGGSMLIERVFDIQGFGLLQFQSVIGRDYPVVMGTLTISSLLVLLGNVLSDFIVASLDPRIKFR